MHSIMYMMPGGSRNGNLRLHKATKFHLRWKFHNSCKNGHLKMWIAPSPLGT
uniref:Glucosamine inositolphosphorylceramide transferase 1 N-terminal domain-containing protein n=2 Tax=Physcomitrium patens TaxID=3218 RepID=A0A2K1KF22_PHYPA|nr:hypothetical protein PHYPA_008723 [Physcomitrium patens]